MEINQERRKEKRRIYASKFRCRPIQGDYWHGTSIDISDSGFGFEILRRYEVNTKLIVEFEDGPTVMVQVVRHERPTDTTWRHGCKILSMICGEEFKKTNNLAADLENILEKKSSGIYTFDTIRLLAKKRAQEKSESNLTTNFVPKLTDEERCPGL
jgi:hypothetical protein